MMRQRVVPRAELRVQICHTVSCSFPFISAFVVDGSNDACQMLHQLAYVLESAEIVGRCERYHFTIR